MRYLFTICVMLSLISGATADTLNAHLEKAVHNQAEPAWQILEIIGTDSMTVQQRFKELQPHIKSGLIEQAVILDGQDEEQALYQLKLRDGKVTAYKTALPQDKPLPQALALAFSKLTPGQTLHTGIFVSAHANGRRMLYHEQDLKLRQLLQYVQQKQLAVEVLQLDSCNMGNLLSLHDIAQTGRVHYVLVASSLMCGNRIIDNPSFAAYLPQATTALHKVLQVRLQRHGKWGFSYTNNLVVADLSQVNSALKTWEQSYRNFIRKNPRQANGLTRFEDKTQEDPSWYSLTELLKWQITQTQTMSDPAAQGFTAQTKKLLNALNNSLVEQWCYSKLKDKVFQGQYIPPQSGCLNGFAANSQQITEVVKTP